MAQVEGDDDDWSLKTVSAQRTNEERRREELTLYFRRAKINEKKNANQRSQQKCSVDSRKHRRSQSESPDETNKPIKAYQELKVE